MAWSMWGGAKNDAPKNDAPKKRGESRNAWFHGAYQGPVWGITTAIALSIYLRYFNGPAYDDKVLVAKLITIGAPLVVALGSAFYAWSVFTAKRDLPEGQETETGAAGQRAKEEHQ